VSKKNELAPQSPSMLPALVTDFGKPQEDDVFTIEDNMEGVVPRLPAIKIGKDIFELPNDEVTKEFNGIILKHHGCRTWWEDDDIKAGRRPDCSSKNGVLADPTPPKCPIPPQQRAANKEKYKNEFVCATCPMNIWDTDPKGPGKACKERHRFFVLVTDKDLASAVPYSLTVSPGSLSAKDAYFTDLTGKNIPFQTVITSFGLEKATNRDGKPYSKLTLRTDPKKRLSKDDQLILKDLISKFKASFEQELDAADVAEAAPADSAPAEEGSDEFADRF